MKKFAIATLVSLAAIAAGAAEVGVTVNHDTVGADRSGLGLTVGQKFGAVGVTAGVESFTKGANNLQRYSLVGSYDVAKLGSATVAVKAGAAYLNNQVGSNGYAAVAGVGVSVPVAAKVNAVVGLTNQQGRNNVRALNGNTVTAGLTYSF